MDMDIEYIPAEKKHLIYWLPDSCQSIGSEKGVPMDIPGSPGHQFFCKNGRLITGDAKIDDRPDRQTACVHLKTKWLWYNWMPLSY